MSVVTNIGGIMPQIITQTEFPYFFNIPDREINSDFINILRLLEFPRTDKPFLSNFVDPSKGNKTGPQSYEYRYQNKDGIDVVIRGSYNDAMAVKDTLDTYPPMKRDNLEKDDSEYEDLISSSVNRNTSTANSVPEVGRIIKGKYIHIIMDKKIYSGSGALIMVYQNKPTLDAKFVFFRNSSNGKYADLGGKIDPLRSDKYDKDILFTNAKKESEEESIKLFTLNNALTDFIDIETNKTHYRVYLYLLKIPNVNLLSKYYNVNRSIMLEDSIMSSKESYTETDNLVLIDYNTFFNKLKSYDTDYAKYGVFRDIKGSHVNVDSRAMIVVKEAKTKLEDMIEKCKDADPIIDMKKIAGGYNNFVI